MLALAWLRKTIITLKSLAVYERQSFWPMGPPFRVHLFLLQYSIAPTAKI